MRKQTLYDFLKKEKIKAIQNIEVEVKKRKQEMIDNALSKRVEDASGEIASLRDLITGVLADSNVIRDKVDEIDDLTISSYMRGFVYGSHKPEDVVLITYAGFEGFKDAKLRELEKADNEVRATFSQLNGVVKNNTAKRAAALLVELGMEVPKEEAAMLPAIKVDMSAYARWGGMQDEVQ